MNISAIMTRSQVCCDQVSSDHAQLCTLHSMKLCTYHDTKCSYGKMRSWIQIYHKHGPHSHHQVLLKIFFCMHTSASFYLQIWNISFVDENISSIIHSTHCLYLSLTHQQRLQKTFLLSTIILRMITIFSLKLAFMGIRQSFGQSSQHRLQNNYMF